MLVRKIVILIILLSAIVALLTVSKEKPGFAKYDLVYIDRKVNQIRYESHVTSSDNKYHKVVTRNSYHEGVKYTKPSSTGRYLAIYGSLRGFGEKKTSNGLYIDDLNDDKPPYSATGKLGKNEEVLDIFHWAPDGSKLSYLIRSTNSSLGKLKLFTIDIQTENRQAVMSEGTDGISIMITHLWSPDSKHLAFLADPEHDQTYALYVEKVGYSGSIKNISKLTSGKNIHVRPDYIKWSPNGKNIVYVTENPMNQESLLYMSSFDGKNKTLLSAVELGLTPTPIGTHYGFTWSPDSQYLAYSIAEQSGRAGLYIVNAEGQPFNRHLTRTLFKDEQHRQSLRNNTPNSQVTDMPNSKDSDGPKKIFLRGSRLNQAIQYGVEQFAWSPDGNMLAFSGDFSLEDVDLYVAYLDGKLKIKNISRRTDKIFHQAIRDFRWSYDSQNLAYITETNENSGLYVKDFEKIIDAEQKSVNETNSEKNRADFIADNVIDIAWSRISNTLAYTAVSNTTRDAFELYTIQADAGSSINVSKSATNNTVHVSRFRWSFVSDELAFIVNPVNGISDNTEKSSLFTAIRNGDDGYEFNQIGDDDHSVVDFSWLVYPFI